MTIIEKLLKKENLKYSRQSCHPSPFSSSPLGERSGEGVNVIAKSDSPLRHCEGASAPEAISIFLIDTIGTLTDIYKLADVVFVGGSLVDKGGQNIIEPASLYKPVIFGPYMNNFKDEAKLLLESDGAVQIEKPEDLAHKIKAILNDPIYAKNLSQNATKILKTQQGSISKTIETLSSRT